MKNKKQIRVYYDKECPFCEKYSKYIELKKLCDIELIDARTNKSLLNNLKEEGFDINDGVILELDSQIFQGFEAVQKIDSLLEKNDLKSKFFSFLINLNIFEKIIYPFFKFLRKIVLLLLRKDMEI